MNKKILAAAVAAAMVAPAAAFANDVTIYGIAHLSVDWLDSDNEGVDGWDIQSNASRLGFKGTEDLANGLKAIWKMEFQVDMADAGTDGSVTNVSQGKRSGAVAPQKDLWQARNAYVGLAGGFGTFLVGRHDTPMKMSTGKLDLFSDELGDYNSTLDIYDIRTNSAIAYVSPNWSGFSFAAATVAPHVYYNGVVVTTSQSVDANGNVVTNRTVTDVGSSDSDDLAGAYSLAATFDNAGFFATVAYEVLTDEWLDAWAQRPSGASNDDEKWRFGLGWTGAGFTVGGVYEMEDSVLGTNTDKDAWQISAGYTFGNNMVKAMYGQVDYDYNTAGISDDDVTSWAVGLDHNFSKRTKVYIQYVDKDTDYDATDISGASLGMVHKF